MFPSARLFEVGRDSAREPGRPFPWPKATARAPNPSFRGFDLALYTNCADLLSNQPKLSHAPVEFWAGRDFVRVRRFLEEKAFAAQQRLGHLAVPDMPHFDSAESTEWFLAQLASATRYLEYGTGGSTYQAAKLGLDFIAVDTDPYFLDSVRAKIHAAGLGRAGQVFRFANIGWTGTWGRPVGRVTEARRELFRRASDPPPECFEGLTPDLVLVDGRFRVACAFKVFNMLHAQPGWTVVVDDYADRPQYRAIEEYAQVELVGRMAVIRSARAVPASVINRWETIPA